MLYSLIPSSHVAAILVAVEQCVEQCVREGLNAPSVTSEPCVWSRINKNSMLANVSFLSN